MLTHRNLLVNATQGAELVPLAAGDRVGMLLPLFHANAQVVTCRDPDDDPLRGGDVGAILGVDVLGDRRAAATGRRSRPSRRSWRRC